MSQRTVLRFYHFFGRHFWLIGISMFVATLDLVGCRSPMAGTDQSSSAAKSANIEGGPFKRIGIPVGITGYGDPIFSGNSRRFIALNYRAAKGVVRVWDAATLQPLCGPLPETGPAWGLTFDGRIAFTTDFQNIRLWNVDTSKLICVTKVTDGKLDDVAISPDGRQFLTFAEGGHAVEVWRAGETRPRLIIKQDLVLAAFDPTGTRIAIYAAGKIYICSAETGKKVCPLISYRSLIRPELTELFDPTGRWLIVYEYDGFLVVDVATGRPGGEHNRYFIAAQSA
jgi:WD40 repeat protein